MGIEFYAFALFIAALICLIAILLKLLFANVRRQRKMLDEKESKLLQLYQTVESIMENFNDQIKTAMEDIKEYENRAAERMVALSRQEEPVIEKKEEPERAPRVERSAKAMTVDSSRIRAASEVLERAERMIKSSTEKYGAATAARSGNVEVIQRLFDDSASEQPANGAELEPKNKKRDAILMLAKDGKTHAQIAKELGITQNEVKLVIGLGNTKK